MVTPKFSQLGVRKIIESKKLNRIASPVVVLAVRGYYLNNGNPGENDRGIYDDAVFIDSPDNFFASVWNTDPSKILKGLGFSNKKGMAVLNCGVWAYRIGQHHGRGPACNQAEAVTVTRDGLDGNYLDSGWFGINHHWGGNWSTGSEGCQTAPPDVWAKYIDHLVKELEINKQSVFKYVLIDEQERRQTIGV